MLENVILWAMPYLMVAGILWVVYMRKTAQNKKLIAQALENVSATTPAEAIQLLKDALWKANEKPELELSVLGELAFQYQRNGIAFDCQNYVSLIEQCQELFEKESASAERELQEVQARKRMIIDRMPDLPDVAPKVVQMQMQPKTT